MGPFQHLKVFTGRRFAFNYVSPAICAAEFTGYESLCTGLCFQPCELPFLRCDLPCDVPVVVTIYPPDGSEVALPFTVTLVANVYEATIYYTLDGTDPTPENGIKYLGPFVITEQVPAIKAVGVVEI